ncbi:MAG: hypothetical protein ACYSW2_12315 [Planctomycetota bacterium]|jgi:twitching motility protein PilT
MPEDLDIRRLFHKMENVEASDLHIKIGSPPVLRIASDLHEVKTPPLSEEQTKSLLDPIVPDHLKQKLEDEGGLDFSHMEGSAHRYRCSIFHAGGGIHAAIRRVNPKIPSFKELNLPDVYERVARTSHEGLVVVCGVTGCGKSTSSPWRTRWSTSCARRSHTSASARSASTSWTSPTRCAQRSARTPTSS